jgi:uncharacterized protein YndB with AHSA1/START domain
MATRAETAGDTELRITRTFRAPVSLVWRMWAEPDLRSRWWGPEGFACISLHQDFRPGGLWRVHIRSAEEGDLRASGAFQEIEACRRLRFTFRWDQRAGEEAETVATVRLEPRDGGGPVQHFHQTRFHSVRSRDGHRAGWNSTFNRLEGLAEASGETDNDNA